MIQFVRSLLLPGVVIGVLAGASGAALADFPACEARFRFTWEMNVVPGSFSARVGTPCSLQVFMWGNAALTSVRVISPPKYGQASVSGAVINFKPKDGYRGPDSMTVKYFGMPGLNAKPREATVTFAITIY